MPCKIRILCPHGCTSKDYPWMSLQGKTPLNPFYFAVHTISCHEIVITDRQNHHLKFSGIPTFSKYSCLAFSLSSGVPAVLYRVYNSRFTIASNFSCSPDRILSSSHRISARKYFTKSINNSSGIVTFFFFSIFFSFLRLFFCQQNTTTQQCRTMAFAVLISQNLRLQHRIFLWLVLLRCCLATKNIYYLKSNTRHYLPFWILFAVPF